MAELTRQGSSESMSTDTRLPSLTGLRFVAAAMVFLHHATFANLFAAEKAANTFVSIVALGNTGVTFFFILSGFVLTWSARPTDTPPRFWRRRFFKIYPNHIVVFAVAALLIGSGVATFGVTAPLELPAALANLTLVHAWRHDLAVIFSVNLVAWSLACEVFFYLLFPLLHRIIKRINPQQLWAWAGVMVAAIIAVPFLARALPNEPPIPQVGMTTWEIWFVQVFPPVRMLEFILGMLLARLILSGRRMPVGFGGAAAITIAAYALTPFFPPTFRLAATMAVPLGLLIAAAATADATRQRSWLASRPMVWLGDISYAFYLWHYMVIMTIVSMLAAPGVGMSTPSALGLLVLMFAVTILLSWLLYSIVERPVMRHFATARRYRALPAAAGSGGDRTPSQREASR